MAKDKSFSPPTTGGASLLTVFAVLCLTVFALLSLSTARADMALSDASGKAVFDYYAADGRAQEVLACLRTGAEPPEDILVTTYITDHPDHSETLCCYSVPISDRQELQVEVELKENGGYLIRRWLAVPVGDWSFDDSLDLWDGEDFFED